MANQNAASMPVIRRLPRYYRHLTQLLKNGKTRISSTELAARLGLTASQIRHDLNCFGGFGQQGYGYNVEQLKSEIGKILYLNERIPAILIGVGNLGHALCSYLAKQDVGVELIGRFDKTPEKCVRENDRDEIWDMTRLEEFCVLRKPKIAILCIPGDGARELARKLADYGISGIWNFTHAELEVFDGLSVENVHLGDSFMTLNYMVHREFSDTEEYNAD